MKQLLLLGAFLITFFKGHTQTNITDSILHESVYRSYIVHIPPGFNLGKSLPVVFVLHGRKESAKQVMNYSGFNTVADTGNFIVVYPEGYIHSWADGRGISVADSAGIDDVDFISSLIDTLHFDYNADGDHIYATGIWNGGFMVQRLACQLAHKISAVASINASLAGNLIQPCNSSQTVPMLFLKGSLDANTSYNQDKISDEISQDLSHLIEDEGLNSYSFENSAAEIWNFFKLHSLKTFIRSNSLTEVKTNYNQYFTAFPNPVQGSLFLSYTNGSIDYVEIFDHDSKRVFSLSGNDITYPIDVSNLARGLYMIKVHTGDGETIKTMMVKD
jgi:hypothetical protein